MDIKQCNEKFFMESRISLTSPTNSIHGLLTQHRPSVSVPMTQSISEQSLTPMPKSDSLLSFKSGDSSNSHGQESPCPPRSLPSAETIETSKGPSTRYLKMSYEEVDAWRQVLNQFKKDILKAASGTG